MITSKMSIYTMTITNSKKVIVLYWTKVLDDKVGVLVGLLWFVRNESRSCFKSILDDCIWKPIVIYWLDLFKHRFMIPSHSALKYPWLLRAITTLYCHTTRSLSHNPYRDARCPLEKHLVRMLLKLMLLFLKLISVVNLGSGLLRNRRSFERLFRRIK